MTAMAEFNVRKVVKTTDGGEAPKVIYPEGAPKNFKYDDEHVVTALYNFGSVDPKHKEYLGTVLFVGGVATDVPWAEAKHWIANTRPIKDAGTDTGKVAKSYFRVRNLVILPPDTDPLDYDKYAGRMVNTAELARALGAANVGDLIGLLGVSRTEEILAELQEALKAEKSETEAPTVIPARGRPASK